MNVKELIEKLNDFDPEFEVYFCYDYGDRVGSIVAEPVTCISESTLLWSEYHRRYSPDDDEFYDPDDILNQIHPPIEVVLFE